MNRRVALLLLAGAVFGAAAIARGQDYTGSVLYPLSTPSGFNSANPPLQLGEHGAFAGQTIGSGFTTMGVQSALLWNAAGSAAALGPTGYMYAEANGTDGPQQVGDAYTASQLRSDHALLWSGTAASVVDLTPTNASLEITDSVAYGVSGGQQVGYGWGGDGISQVANQALLWTGSAASAVDLGPGIAYGTDGTQQVGESANGATLWTDTAASVVSLNPTNPSLGITGSVAYGVGGNQQVGYGFGSGTGNADHALLWTGTAASAVDLNPTSDGFADTFASDTNGSVQVGDGYGSATGDQDNALAWTGSSDSFINLQTLLPAGITWEQSKAYTVDSSGNVYGIAIGMAGGVYNYYAVEWSPVPEPASASLLLIVGGAALMRRQRRLA
ncbi:MAG: PEP-CTERM sorting domain-containing protein [Tepidisphaeraceae bacterium]